MEIRFEEALYEREGFRLRLDLVVPSGAKVAVIGPSGAGKSTLLSVIAGFEGLRAGRLLLGGKDQADVPPSARPVSMVFQDHNLFPHLTVAQNAGLGLDPGLRLGADQRAARDRVLDEVGLGGFGERRPAELSGGQRSRAALARALLRDRPVLLLDEPFAALGPALRADMLGLVRRLAEAHAMTLLMVTHDPRDAELLGGQTIVVAEGVVEPPRPTAALLADPPPALRAYLGT